MCLLTHWPLSMSLFMIGSMQQLHFEHCAAASDVLRVLELVSYLHNELCVYDKTVVY